MGSRTRACLVPARLAEINSPKGSGHRNTPRPRQTLTEQVQKAFCDLLGRGIPIDTVCDYLGVSHEVYHEWLRKGERAQESGDPLQTIFAEFLQSILYAVAKYKVKMIDKLHIGSKTWYRELSILERRDRRNFSKLDPMGGSTEDFDPDERFI